MDPALIRRIVDETAELVAKRGSDFERRLIADDSQRQQATYSFLVSSDDPYSAYYQQRLSEFRTQNEQGKLNKPISAPTSVPTDFGIKHPPEDVRNFVDKTAQFVAKNGPEYEKRVIAHNTGKTKLSFLASSVLNGKNSETLLTKLHNPYHAYYQHRLSEFRAQNHSSWKQPSSQPEDSAALHLSKLTI